MVERVRTDTALDWYVLIGRPVDLQGRHRLWRLTLVDGQGSRPEHPGRPDRWSRQRRCRPGGARGPRRGSPGADHQRHRTHGQGDAARL